MRAVSGGLWLALASLCSPCACLVTSSTSSPDVSYLSHSLQQLHLCLGTIDRMDRELSQLRAELRAVGTTGHGAAGPGGMGVGRYGV